MSIFKIVYIDKLRIELKRKYYERKLRRKIKKGLIDLDYILKNVPDAYRIFTNYSSGEQKEDYIEANNIKEAIQTFYNKYKDNERKRYQLCFQPELYKGE